MGPTWDVPVLFIFRPGGPMKIYEIFFLTEIPKNRRKILGCEANFQVEASW